MIDTTIEIETVEKPIEETDCVSFTCFPSSINVRFAMNNCSEEGKGVS